MADLEFKPTGNLEKTLIWIIIRLNEIYSESSARPSV